VLIFVAGKATVELDGVPSQVNQGHVVFVPAGASHGVATDDDLAVFYNVHASRAEARLGCDHPWG
jgi:quercetin dioxygenase-like cupin family protein